MDECTGFENRRAEDVTIAESDTYAPSPGRLAPGLPDFTTPWPDLAEVAAAWPRLPEAVRAGIVAMTKAAVGPPVGDVPDRASGSRQE